MATRITSRDVKLTLPPDVAEGLDALASYLDRDQDYLVLQALRSYIRKWTKAREQLEAPIDPTNPDSLSMAQVNAMVKEGRIADAKAAETQAA